MLTTAKPPTPTRTATPTRTPAPTPTTAVLVVATPTATAQQAQLAVASTPAVEAASKSSAADNGNTTCEDGELLFRDTYPEGEVSPRVPLGEAEREDIVELSWPGQGFGGLDRAILVTPRLGPVWGVNIIGAQTIGARGFCGWGDEVTNWAKTQHIPSLQQASRDTTGAQPATTEIGVFRLNYEDGILIQVVPGAQGVAEGLLSRLDVTFSEGNNHSAQPLTLKK